MAQSDTRGLPGQGQTLIEILIGITVGAIIIGGTAGALVVTFKASLENKSFQNVSYLNQELMDNVTSFSEANWRNVYDLNKSPNQYYINIVSGGFAAVTGPENIVIEGVSYDRSFTVDNVNRDANGDISDTGTDDPSTQKITVTTSWQSAGETKTIPFVKYLTRSRNAVFGQTDWSGGYGENGPLTNPNTRFSTSTNIDYSGTAGAIKLQPL